MIYWNNYWNKNYMGKDNCYSNILMDYIHRDFNILIFTLSYSQNNYQKERFHDFWEYREYLEYNHIMVMTSWEYVEYL